MRNLVYFSPLAAQPTGGIKVFYRHAQRVNALGLAGWAAQVFHWEQPGALCEGFEHRAPMKGDGEFNPASDVAVLPECHLRDFWRQFAGHGVPYGIFVQNGYLIGTNPELSAEEVLQAYRQAAFILTISDDTTECVRLFAPECAHKVVRVAYAIPQALFHTARDEDRERLIAFMPRKLPDHAQRVVMFLRRALPPGWKIVSIHGVPESEVAAMLRRSKIFMSFCSFEGLPMPPAEAALCGNHVVGYTGQGAQEYWEPGLFTEVASGDVRDFAARVLATAERLDARQRLGLPHLSDEARVALELTRTRFSDAMEAASLKAMLGRLDEMLPRAA